MKIISKDSIETVRPSSSQPKPQRVSKEPVNFVLAPANPKRKKRDKDENKAKKAKRRQENTRGKNRDNLNIAPKQQDQKPEEKTLKKEQNIVKERQIERAFNETESTYIQKQFERFQSLLRFNITFKLTFGFMFRILFMVVFLAILVYGSFSYYLFYTEDTHLANKSVYLSSLINDGTSYNDTIVTRYLNAENLQMTLYDDNQNIIYSNIDSPRLYSDMAKYEDFNLLNFPNFPTLKKITSVVIGGSYYTMGLESNMNASNRIIESTFPIALVILVVLSLSTLRSVNKMSHKTLKPIHAMTHDVQEMSANNLSTRLNVSGTKDELKDLAATFNSMLDDIQKSYEREKQFVSDASHELRTPIAVIKGYAGMLNRWGKDDPAILEESITAILGETDNMHSLVESLLFIARNDKGTLKMDMADFNLTDLMHEISKETQLIDSQHIITETIEDGLMQFGSTDKLKQAIRVFIDNAIKYTPDEGEIKILLKASASQNIIVISDNGIGISKEDLPHIFDRFYRADKSRTKLKANQHGGTGLGLSIAKIIVEQHGGKIHVASDLNKGTIFTLFLPRQSNIQ